MKTLWKVCVDLELEDVVVHADKMINNERGDLIFCDHQKTGLGYDVVMIFNRGKWIHAAPSR